MNLVRVDGPAVLPLTIMDIKKHLRITDDDTEDDLLGAYLVSAVEEIDGVAGLLQRALITQTWDLKLDGFPRMWRKSGGQSWRRDPIRLPLPPLQEVVSVKYRDLAGNEQTLDAGRYQVTGIGDQRLRGEIVPAFGFEWPDTREDTPEAVTIRFKAGYGDDGNDVPEPIRHALMMIVAERHCDREGEMGMPPAAKALLDPYIVMGL